MDKKSKEALRRYKKARQIQSSSDTSSSSDSDSGSSSSYSSSDSGRRHRHKKSRQMAEASASRHFSSSSEEERRKRERREHCKKKLEAKRSHLKRKLREAKLKKKAAAAAAALSGHSHRALSPSTQAKLRKLAERKHLRAASKERKEREREKRRAALKEREREHHRLSSRSPSKISKMRLHQEMKRQLSPPRVHQQLMSREKIIIQTRNRERTPSIERERQRHEHKLRHDELARERDRRERELARERERAEALARCQERQRERERLAREKLRREEEEKYLKGSSGDRERDRDRERALPRSSDCDMTMNTSRGYSSRERSLERCKRDVNAYDHGYLRNHREPRDYMCETEHDRRGHSSRDELLRDREYLSSRRRELSPTEYKSSSSNRIRSDPRDAYTHDERDRSYKRSYPESGRTHAMDCEPWLNDREIRDVADYREMEPSHMYASDRERMARDHDRPFGRVAPDWKHDWPNAHERIDWTSDDITNPPVRNMGFAAGTPKRGTPNIIGKIPPPREHRSAAEHEWGVPEVHVDTNKQNEPNKVREPALQREWGGLDNRNISNELTAPNTSVWPQQWREPEDNNYQRDNINPIIHHNRNERGGRGGFRRGAGNMIDHGMHGIHNFRPHMPHTGLLNLPTQNVAGYHGAGHVPRFSSKRMTYTNPNIIKKQQAALAAAKAAAQASAAVAASTAVAAAKAAAQSAANANTNPGLLSQVGNNVKQSQDEKPEIGEILTDMGQAEESKTNATPVYNAANPTNTPIEKKQSGELSEISDSDDDILTKSEKKLLMPEVDESQVDKTLTDANSKEIKFPEDRSDEELLDFEEISDGELEEEARSKGIGDALGVDWASLVADSKRVTNDPVTTAKQKWQTHRIILETGVSAYMAGSDYARHILNDAKQKLDAELKSEKQQIKIELDSVNVNVTENAVQSASISNENTTSKDNNFLTDDKTDIKPEVKTLDILQANDKLDKETAMHPLASVQVARRQEQTQRANLITNLCANNNQALSARQDLILRRQLCGLPARECQFIRNLTAPSEKLKSMALAAFQRSLEVK